MGNAATATNSSSLADSVRRALADWKSDEYLITQTADGDVTVGVGTDLVGTSYARGGNAASALLNSLRAAGLAGDRGWEDLRRGETATVTRFAYPTPDLAELLYGPLAGLTPTQRRAKLTSAAAWARRKDIGPINPGFTPALWPADEVDLAVSESRDRRGNHTSGEQRRRRNPDTN